MTALRVAAVTSALLAVSCGAPLMKLPSGPGAPAPDAAAAFAEATAACRGISSISAEIAVSGSVGGRRMRGRILAGLAAPSAAYLEAPAPFGAPVFIFGADGDDATLLLPRDRRVLEHGRPAAILEAIAGVPLGPADLRATVTGCADAPAVFADARGVGGDWRVIPGVNDVYLRRERAAAPWRLVAVVRPGADGWRADFRDFLNGLPRSIRLTSLAEKRFDLRLELSQVDLNTSLDPQTFRVAVPPGTAPITIDELRDSGPLAR